MKYIVYKHDESSSIGICNEIEWNEGFFTELETCELIRVWHLEEAIEEAHQAAYLLNYSFYEEIIREKYGKN